MKKFIFTFVLATLLSVAQGQNENLLLDSTYQHQGIENLADEGFETPSRLSAGLTAGSSFAWFGGASSFETYLAPKLDYRLTSRLNISAGVMVVNSNFNNLLIPTGDGTYENGGNMLSSYFFSAGDYQVNERLRISGAILYGTNNSFSQGNNFSQYDNVSYSFGAEYKISEHFSIGVQFRQRRGYNPFSPSPYSSYGRNPFHSTYYGGW